MTTIDFAAMRRAMEAELARSGRNEDDDFSAGADQNKLLVVQEGFEDGTVLVCEDFLSDDEERQLIDCAQNGGLVPLEGRRVGAWGGTPKPGVDDPPMVEEPLPLPAARLVPRIVRALDQAKIPHGRINNCLVNEYGPGMGIGFHNDGPLYESFVAVVSCGVKAILQFAEPGMAFAGPEPKLVGVVEIPRKSLLVFSGRAYDSLLHRIPKGNTVNDSGTRVSFTFRSVKRSVPRADGLEGLGFTENERDEAKRRRAAYLLSLSELKKT